jgi:casein kinase II subunit beta
MSLSSSGTSLSDDGGWIQYFCDLPGNECFCEIEKQFIEDSFNLFGLKGYMPPEHYNSALNIILDKPGMCITLFFY